MPGHTGVVPVITPGVEGVAGLTETVISLLVAVKGAAHIAFEVKITRTLSRFIKVVVVKVVAVAPLTFTPFSCH